MRIALPNRRPSVTTTTEWQGHRFTVTVGFYLNGTPADVFADSPHAPPMVQGILSDACVQISLGLQHGITPEQLGKSLGTVPFAQLGPDGLEMVDAPASPIGPIIEEIRKAAP